MPVNPYDDRKVSLRRPHGNGDLDIVRASYTRRKANVTKALEYGFKLLLRRYSRMSDLNISKDQRKKHRPYFKYGVNHFVL